MGRNKHQKTVSTCRKNGRGKYLHWNKYDGRGKTGPAAIRSLQVLAGLGEEAGLNVWMSNTTSRKTVRKVTHMPDAITLPTNTS